MSLTYGLLVFQVIMCPVISDGQPSRMENLQHFAQLCSHRLCNLTNVENMSTQEAVSCCQRCSCSPDCYKVANCCPDVQLSISSEPEYECIDLANFLDEERDIKRVSNQKTMGYRMATKCPDTDDTVSFPECEAPVSLEDYVPVSDTVYEMVFKNRHCAMCHGVENYIAWKIFANCEEIDSMSFETFDQRDDYILNNCSITPIPPDSEKADSSRCYDESDIIDTCNSSLQWDFYDRDLEYACQRRPRFNTVYTYHELFGKTNHYRNEYCFLCNKPKNIQRSDFCRVAHPHEYRGLIVSFSALIRLLPDDISTEVGRCSSTEIWDPFDVVCRTLLCPMSTIPQHSVCISSSIPTEGFKMSLVFEATFSTLDNTNLAYSAAQLTNHIIRTLGPEFYCGSCYTGLFRYMEQKNIYFDVPFFTTKRCLKQDLISRLQDLVSRETITYTGHGLDGSLRILLKTSLDELRYKKRNYLVTVKPPGARLCPNAVQLTKDNIQSCPRIEFLEHRWNSFKFHRIPLTTLLHNATLINFEKNTVSVCVEDYFLMRDALMQTNNGRTALGELRVVDVTVLVVGILINLGFQRILSVL